MKVSDIVLPGPAFIGRPICSREVVRGLMVRRGTSGCSSEHPAIP
jgi:hypothetical protein